MKGVFKINPIIIKIAFSYLIDLMLILLAIRAILSWFPGGPMGNPIYSFFCRLTEPYIAPVRSLIDRFPSYNTMPVDLSIFATGLFLILIRRIVLFL